MLGIERPLTTVASVMNHTLSLFLRVTFVRNACCAKLIASTAVRLIHTATATLNMTLSSSYLNTSDKFCHVATQTLPNFPVEAKISWYSFCKHIHMSFSRLADLT